MRNIIAIVALCFVSCEKVVDLQIKDNQSQLIIAGNVTNEAGPYIVSITRSLPLKDTGAYPAIEDAVVMIGDDAGNQDTLVSVGGGRYETRKLIGVAGRTYTLIVQVGEDVYTAQSTMPALVSFDEIKVEQLKVVGDTEYNLIPVYTDPVQTGNKYRFVLTVNGKVVNQHFVQDDVVKNGVVNTDRLEINDDDVKLKKGYEVNVEMQCVDAKVALYYTTLALIGDSGPGGGATPNNPPSNISNGALGLFSAHTTQHRGVTIAL